MSTCVQRTLAVEFAGQLLRDICNKNKTIKEIRAEAQHILRHYPMKMDMDEVCRHEDQGTQANWGYKVFGKNL